MIACLLIPGFELRAVLFDRPRLALKPAALAPLEGAEPLIGSVTAAAEAAGVRPGMRMGEALATCPSLVLVERDPARAEQAWEDVLRRLEDRGFSVEPEELGCAYFETRGVERRPPGTGPGRVGRPDGRLPRPAAARAPPARARPGQRAEGAGSEEARRACRASGRGRSRTSGAGRPPC